MLQELFDLLLLKYTRNLLLLGIMDSSRQEHDQIFQTLSDRDSEGLQSALATHLGHVRTHIIEGFKKMVVSRKESMVDLFSFQ
jgi:DNA-binding GntR family transcriptional regulator